MECRLCNLIRVPGSGISKSGKFLLKLRAHHSGKFASQEKTTIRYNAKRLHIYIALSGNDQYSKNQLKLSKANPSFTLQHGTHDSVTETCYTTVQRGVYLLVGVNKVGCNPGYGIIIYGQTNNQFHFKH